MDGISWMTHQLVWVTYLMINIEIGSSNVDHSHFGWPKDPASEEVKGESGEAEFHSNPNISLKCERS